MAIEIIPFQAEHLDQAVRLLAYRFGQYRLKQPELPARYAEPLSARQALEAALQRKHAAGMAAIQGSRLLGYMIGDLDISELWGRSGWVRTAGYALADDQDPELLRDLYAEVSRPWVEAGCFGHHVQVPAEDAGLAKLWFSLSFGIQHVRGLQQLAPSGLEEPVLPPGVAIRQVGPEDRDLVASFSDVIWKHQVGAPVWAIHPPEANDREGWAELADDPEVVAWVATLDGRPAATQSYYPSELGEDLMLVPEKCVHLAAAATRPWARRRGIMAALTQQGLADIYERGYRWCETDWRSTNLLSSRYWPRKGFKPAIYRLARQIDPRISWANGRTSLHLQK